MTESMHREESVTLGLKIFFIDDVYCVRSYLGLRRKLKPKRAFK